MNSTLQDKVILITGGAKRLGAAISRLLHANGANLMIHYRSSASEARALQAELNLQRPNSVAIIHADLLNMAVLPSLIQETVQHFGRLDVLVNNASSYYATEIGEIGESQWEDLVGSNLKAPLFLSQASAPELRKHQGCIVNITDMHVERPKKGYIVYSFAKAGLVTLTKSLAHELAQMSGSPRCARPRHVARSQSSLTRYIASGLFRKPCSSVLASQSISPKPYVS